jgi:DNA-binding GntR family transcriptional regulator
MSRAADHAYSEIRGMILSGELAPGSQLSEEALALRCDVSRTPVRDALRRLESDLLVRRSESLRTFVAEWSLDDIADSFELRALLESHAAQRAAERIGPDEIARLQALNDAILRAVDVENPDVAVFLENNREFHAIVTQAAGSPRLASTLNRVVEQPVVWRTAQHYDRVNLMRSCREHAELIAAFERRDGTWAASVMTGHIRRAYHAYADAHSVSAQSRSPSA